MNKEDVIILPGWGMDEYAFSRLVPKLSQDFNVMFASWKNVQSQGDFLKEVISLVKRTNKPCTLLGWSLGVLIAVEITHSCPGLVKNLILISGTSCFTMKKDEDYIFGVRSLVIEKMKKRLLENKEKTVSDFVKQMFSEQEKEDSVEFIEDYKELKDYDEKALIAGLDCLIKADSREEIGKIKIPVLLLHGEKDNICPMGAAEFMKDRLGKNAKSIILKQSGHIPFFTQPELCAEFINKFLTQS